MPSNLPVVIAQGARHGLNTTIGTAEKMFALFVGMNQKINI